MAKYPYLTDADFLKQIDELQVKQQFINLVILNMNDDPIANIEGRATGGSISLNGSSAIRRSGSLSMVADANTYKITDVTNLISINKRASVEIGIENPFPKYTEYPILWFPLGVFVLTNASINHSLQGFTISVNLKDKMALLNGECGGTLVSPMVHSPLLVEANGEYIEEPVLFTKLIRTLVHDMGHIPENQIIIEDIPDKVKNIVRWTGSAPLYINLNTFSVSTEPFIVDDELVGNEFAYGDNVGYQLLDFVYPTMSELTSAAGESIMSVLDKIKKTLGNYEYFFDLDGMFRFRKIRNFLDKGSAFDNLELAFNDAYLVQSTGKASYSFVNSPLVSSYSNQPKYEEVKNDFAVWGAKGDNKIAIYYHLVIDNTPSFTEGSYPCNFYTDDFGVIRALPLDTTLAGATEGTMQVWDWRTWLYYDYVVNGNYNDYGEELKTFFPKIYDLSTGEYLAAIGENDDSTRRLLNNMVYWLDILDPNQITNSDVRQALSDLSVSAIGRRTKTINDDKINCLFNPQCLDIIFVKAQQENTAAERRKAIDWVTQAKEDLQQKLEVDETLTSEQIAAEVAKIGWVQVIPQLFDEFAIGTFLNPAYDAVRSILHETTTYNNAISMSVMPIYHLEPNTRITVEDSAGDTNSNIKGDYMINSISIPLALNGMMTINASRAIERI